MTREEAKEKLKDILAEATENEDAVCYVTSDDADVLKAAIQVLEQESILEKIRAEIDQKQYDFMDDKDYDEGIRFGLMLAYQIIDKYRAESEGNDNEDIPMEYFESGGRVLKND